MSDTNLTNARIQLKYDTEANWSTVHNTFIPRSGEMIIYAPDDTYQIPRFKIGNGKTILRKLLFSTSQTLVEYGTSQDFEGYTPLEGEIVIITDDAANPKLKIGNGSDQVIDLPIYGGGNAAQSLVTASGSGIKAGTKYQPVYFNNGIPQVIDYTIGASVPSNAKFTDTKYNLASNSEEGLLSSEDYIALTNLKENGVLKNTYATKTNYGVVMIGDGLEVTNGKIKVDTSTLTNATPSIAGLMSAADKNKLDNIEEEANKIVIDDTLSTTSTNPIQNKVINFEITKLGTLITQENSTTLTAAKNYTNDKIGELLGQAPENLNSLEELAAAMENNPDVVSALRDAIGNKANSSDLTATSSKLDLHTTNKNNPHEVTAAQVGLGNVENKSVATIKNEILTEENISALGFIKEVPEYSALVTSVNGQTGEVQLTAADIGALPNDTIIPEAITVDDSLTSTGINPVQGNVIYSALAEKQPTGDYVTKEYLTNQRYLTGISKTDVTTALGYTPPQSDTNTTYRAGTGLSLSGTTFNIKTGYTDNNKNYKVQTDSEGNLYVNVPWENTVYTLSSTKITTALGYTPAKSSDISTINTTLGNKVDKVSGKGLSTNDFTAAYKTKLDGIAANATANTGTITGVTAGTGLSGGGTSGTVTLNHSNSITEGFVGSAQTASFGGTFAIPKITYNAQGHITEATTVNITLPSAPSIDTSDFLTSSDLGGYVKSTSLGTAAYASDTDFLSSSTSVPTINVLPSYNQNLSGKKGDLQVIV